MEYNQYMMPSTLMPLPTPYSSNMDMYSDIDMYSDMGTCPGMCPGMGMSPGMGMGPDMGMSPGMGWGCPYLYENMYQMPTMPANSSMDEDDMEYMKQLYSEICQKIQPHVEMECDGMDYENSPIYLQYPDRETIEQMVDRIYHSVEEEMSMQLEDMEEIMRQFGNRRDLLRALIGALLLNEIFGRRRPRRRRRFDYDYYPY